MNSSSSSHGRERTFSIRLFVRVSDKTHLKTGYNLQSTELGGLGNNLPFTQSIGSESIDVTSSTLAKDGVFGHRLVPLTGKGSVIAKVLLFLSLSGEPCFYDYYYTRIPISHYSPEMGVVTQGSAELHYSFNIQNNDNDKQFTSWQRYSMGHLLGLTQTLPPVLFFPQGKQAPGRMQCTHLNEIRLLGARSKTICFHVVETHQIW